MLEAIVLGGIQGISEWLPISSEGAIILAKTHFFGGGTLSSLIGLALFLHLGTFLAALIYFRSEVAHILKTAISYKTADMASRNVFRFLFIATVLSGVLGILLLKGLEHIELSLAVTGKLVTGLVGVMLLLTGIMQIRARKGGERTYEDLSLKDSVLLGVAQGLAAIPGISRSGITVSALLLRNVSEERALTLSFLMSLPIVLAGNIALNAGNFTLTPAALMGLFVSFLFGFATIHLLLKAAKKMNFGYFVLVFSLLILLSLLF